MNIVITLESACASGGHANIGVVVDGAAKQVYAVEVDEIRQAIANSDRERVLLDLLRLSVTGLTRAQARTKFQNGFTVVL